MENTVTEQDQENLQAQFLLEIITGLPEVNIEDVRRALERCRSRLGGWAGSARLLGPENICPGCSTPWWFGQYRAELRPRPTATKPLRRLLNKQKEGRPMGRVQTKLLERFLSAKDLVVLECKRCGQVTRLEVRFRAGRTPADRLEAAARVESGQEGTAGEPVTPAGGRRRSRGRDRSAGLIIPASLKTPSSAAGAVAAAAAAAAAAGAPGTLLVGQSPALRAPGRKRAGKDHSEGARRDPDEPMKDGSGDDAGADSATSSVSLDKSSASGGPFDSASTVSALKGSKSESSPIPLKKPRVNEETPSRIPLKKPRAVPSPSPLPSRGKGRGRGSRSSLSAKPATPARAATPASSAEKQRRLQRYMAEQAKTKDNTGLMAFLSEL